jgi:hypothetical protein
MKTETIEKILNFLKEKEGKKIPERWNIVEKFENHPDDIQYKYEGDLNINNKNITKLPNDLYVDGMLDLDGCERLTKLPDKLYVGKTLSIIKTNIEELPDNLYVGGNLFLMEVSIEEIPNNLYVGWNLFIQNTPLAKKYTDEEIYKIVASTGGEIVGNIF